MLYCKKCGVSVTGDKRCCPLCQQELSGTPDLQGNVFPHIEDIKYNKNLLIKLISFVAIASAVISVGVNMAFPTKTGIWWSLFVVAGAFCLWLSSVVAIVKRRNIFKSISWELFLITGFAVLWDLCTGWHLWSLDYVLPCSCMASMLSMYVLSKISKINPRGFAVCMLINVIYGIVPIIFILTDVLNVRYPSIICVMCSIISITAILLFEGKKMRDELTRKLHM